MVVGDILGQNIGPTFKGKSVQEELFLDNLSRNVGN
jgi:hypothetical protein